MTNTVDWSQGWLVPKAFFYCEIYSLTFQTWGEGRNNKHTLDHLTINLILLCNYINICFVLLLWIVKSINLFLAVMRPISFICTCLVNEDQDRQDTFGECVNNLWALNSIYMLMTPKFKSPAWAFPLNSRSVYPTVHCYFHVGA